MGSSPDRVKPKTIYEIDIYYFSAALRRKSKDWLARNQASVSEWDDMSKHVDLVQSESHHHLIEY